MLSDIHALKTEGAKLALWGNMAKGVHKVVDHAISLVVKADGQKILYDNGFLKNKKEFSIEAIAGRMEDTKLRYVLDLHDVKLTLCSFRGGNLWCVLLSKTSVTML